MFAHESLIMLVLVMELNSSVSLDQRKPGDEIPEMGQSDVQVAGHCPN